MRNINCSHYFDNVIYKDEINIVRRLIRRTILDNLQNELDFFIKEEREEIFYHNISHNIMIFSNIIKG